MKKTPSTVLIHKFHRGGSHVWETEVLDVSTPAARHGAVMRVFSRHRMRLGGIVDAYREQVVEARATAKVTAKMLRILPRAMAIEHKRTVNGLEDVQYGLEATASRAAAFVKACSGDSKAAWDFLVASQGDHRHTYHVDTHRVHTFVDGQS